MGAVPAWWIASLGANCSIVVLEYLYRSATFPDFRSAAWAVVPLNVVTAYGLFYAFRGAPSFLLAWAFFTCGNTVLRLLSVHYVIGEPVSPAQLGGVGLMLAGMAALHFAKG